MKVEKPMGKLIQFPSHRVVYNKPQPDITEEEALEIKQHKFIEQITEQLTLDIIHVLQDNVVDTKSHVFLRDLAMVIESIKSLLKRDFGKKHPMHTITDAIAKIHHLADGRKLTDINYSRVAAKKPLKENVDKKEPDVKIEFDPDMNLD